MKSAVNMLIEITEKAEQDLEKIDEYLLNRWNNKVLMNFYDQLETVLENIASGKIVYQSFENSDYSKVLISKHNTLVYHKSLEKITILRIINNFQSEEKKKL